MIDGAVFLAAASDRTQMGKFAVRHRTQVPLEALAKYFAVGFVDPIGWPVFGLRLGAGAFTVLSPPALPFRVLRVLGRRERSGAGALRRGGCRGVRALAALVRRGGQGIPRSGLQEIGEVTSY